MIVPLTVGATQSVAAANESPAFDVVALKRPKVEPTPPAAAPHRKHTAAAATMRGGRRLTGRPARDVAARSERAARSRAAPRGRPAIRPRQRAFGPRRSDDR